MLTAVAVDSQMANGNRFGYQQVIPHSPYHCKHPLGLVYVLQARKRNFLVARESHPKPVQVCQDRYLNGPDQEKPVIPTTKDILDKSVSCSQPFRDYPRVVQKVITFNRQCKFQTFLPYIPKSTKVVTFNRQCQFLTFLPYYNLE